MLLCVHKHPKEPPIASSHPRLHKVGKSTNLRGTPTTQGCLPVLQSPATRRTVTSQGPLDRVTEMQYPVCVPQRKVTAPRLVPSCCNVGSWLGDSGVLTAPASWVPSDGSLSSYCGWLAVAPPGAHSPGQPADSTITHLLSILWRDPAHVAIRASSL